jgi:hypothetical protein
LQVPWFIQCIRSNRSNGGCLCDASTQTPPIIPFGGRHTWT